MPITTVCCCLCGRAVLDDDADSPSWMARFRTIYSLDVDPNTWHLSGPGQRLELHDRISIGDGSKDDFLMIDLNPLSFHPWPTPLAELGDASEASGYPFHIACWGLLSVSCSMEPSDIQLVANLCRSSPIQGGLMNWGHDYGGLANIQAYGYGGISDAQTALAPGEEPQFVRFPRLLNVAVDPWDIPALAHVFNPPTALPTAVASSATNLPVQIQPSKVTHDGPFTKLPFEILSMILVYLPSMDVARLRLASRLFANTPLLDYFWRSRFLPGREFCHVFEAHEASQSCRGRWKQTFDMVRILQTTEALIERKRIWHLGISLHGMLHMMRSSKCEGTAVQSFFEPDAPTESHTTAWVTASRALKGQSTEPSDLFSSGSRSLFERELRLPLPEQIGAIFASTIDLFGRVYISGLRIVDSEDRSFLLGYIHQKSEQLISQIDAQHPCTGFCLAQDQRGVRGIAMISTDESMSPWVGEHYEIPKRRLLTQNLGLKPVDALKGGFDALKLVFLGVASLCDNQQQQQQQQKSSEMSPSLRNTALWYPRVPDRLIRLLGMSGRFLQAGPTELPLCYVVFGGLNGEHLDKISGITVRAHDDGEGLLSVSVDFVGFKRATHFGSNSVQPSIEWPFDIDGPHGERITGIDTFKTYQCFTGLRIHTSLGRVAHFPPDFFETPALKASRSVRVEKDDIVVGFWGTMNTFHGLSDLGLVGINKLN